MNMSNGARIFQQVIGRHDEKAYRQDPNKGRPLIAFRKESQCARFWTVVEDTRIWSDDLSMQDLAQK